MPPTSYIISLPLPSFHPAYGRTSVVTWLQGKKRMRYYLGKLCFGGRVKYLDFSQADFLEPVFA